MATGFRFSSIKRVTMNIQSLILVSAISCFSVALLSAAAQPAGTPSSGGTQEAAAMGDRSEGEVRKIDKENNKITLRHGEIKNLGMPRMTMVFQVKDPAMLDTVKPGDKVMFTADKVNGALTVTTLHQAK